MLRTSQINEITNRVASRVAPADFDRVTSEPIVDSEGKEALRIVIILKPDTNVSFDGDKALDVLVGLQRELQAEGEERFPIIEYAREDELEHE